MAPEVTVLEHFISYLFSIVTSYVCELFISFAAQDGDQENTTTAEKSIFQKIQKTLHKLNVNKYDLGLAIAIFLNLENN